MKLGIIPSDCGRKAIYNLELSKFLIRFKNLYNAFSLAKRHVRKE